MSFSFTKANLFRLSVACLASVSFLTLAYDRAASRPLTEEVVVRQHQLLKLNQARISQWWLDEVDRVQANMSDPVLIGRSVLILQAKRHRRSDFNSPMSVGLRNKLEADSEHRNSVSLLTKGGIVVFSTVRQKLGMYQPLKNTTTSVELSELATTSLNFFTDSVTSQPSISLALPIKTSDQKRAGFFAIELNLRHLNELVVSTVHHPQLDRDFTIPIHSYLVARTSLDRITHIAPPSSLSASEASSYKFQPLHSVGIRKALDGQSGQGFYLDSNSQPVIGVYQYLPNFRMALLVESLQHDVFAPVRHQVLVFFLVGFLLSISPVALGLILDARGPVQISED